MPFDKENLEDVNNEENLEENLENLDDVEVVVDDDIIKEFGPREKYEGTNEYRKKLNDRQLELRNKMFDGTQENLTIDNFREYVKITKEKWLDYYKNEEITHSTDKTFDESKMPKLRFKLEKHNSEIKEDLLPIYITYNRIFRHANMDEIKKVFNYELDIRKEVKKDEKRTRVIKDEFYKDKVVPENREVGVHSVYANTFHLDKIFDYAEKNFSEEHIKGSLDFTNSYLEKLKEKQLKESEIEKRNSAFYSEKKQGTVVSTGGLKKLAKEINRNVVEEFSLDENTYDYDQMYSFSNRLRNNTDQYNKILAYSKALHDLNKAHNNRFWSMIFHPFKYSDEKEVIKGFKYVLDSLGVDEKDIDSLTQKGAEYDENKWKKLQYDNNTALDANKPKKPSLAENVINEVDESEEENLEDIKEFQEQIENEINNYGLNNKHDIDVTFNDKEENKTLDDIENTNEEVSNDQEEININ